VLIGTTTDAGFKLNVNGTLKWGDSTTYAYSGADSGGIYIETVGTTTPTRRLRIQGVNNAGTSYSSILLEAGISEIAFLTADTERMRITSGGNVGIGSTGYSGIKLQITSATSDSSSFAFSIANSSVQDLFYVRSDGYMNTGSRASSPYNLTSGNAANMVVGADGTLYRSTSSLKYKTDIEDYNKGLAEVLRMRPVYYKSINEREKDLQFAGLIAEEIHELGLTEFVQYAKDGTPDALAYSNMVALLVKAIQEQQEQINKLKNA
jgi:hypothetical protein